MDRGQCTECGTDLILRVTDGMVRKHGDCPGGGQPPAESTAGGTNVPPETAVYLVRPGKRNPELQYSLRSLQANTPVERVILVGYCPPWLTGVEHIPTNQSDRTAKSRNMRLGYEAIVEHGPAEFTLWNDDMFAMKPTDLAPTHRGLLSELLRRIRPTTYYKGLKAAADLLPHDALAYDAHHCPLPLTRGALADALELYGGNHGLRTVAANLGEIGGTKVPNAKNPDPELWSTLTYLSTSDKSFRYRDIGAYIRKRLPTPSRWEQS